VNKKKQPRTEEEKKRDHERARQAVEKKIKKKFPNLDPNKFEVI